MGTAPGQKVGYVRVSSSGQNNARQLDGVQLDRLFSDECSGKDTRRPGLTELLRYVRDGDTIYVHSIDRIARSVMDLLTLVRDLNGRGVTLHFVKNGMVFSGNPSPTDKLMLTLLGAVAEFERDMIRERQAEGIAIAKAKGVYKGRKPCLGEADVVQLRELVKTGVPKTVIAKRMGIARATLYAYLDKAE